MKSFIRLRGKTIPGTKMRHLPWQKNCIKGMTRLQQQPFDITYDEFILGGLLKDKVY
jgi:hypothetical protein